MLDSADTREWLSSVARQYTSHLDAMARVLRTVGPYDEIVYLLDFDVIRAYLDERTPESAGTVAADFLLQKSTTPYLVPLGAFLEMTEWLRGSVTTADLSYAALTSDKRAPAIRQLGLNLLGSAAQSMEESELLAELIARLDQRTIRLARLVELLTSPRFQGVDGDYEPSDATVFASLLSYQPRASRSSRDLSGRALRDHRDAINLAIAVKPARDRRAHGSPDIGPRGKLLVTNTRAVAHLSDDLSDQTGEIGRASEESLALLSDLPVALLSDVVRVELLGGVGERRINFLKATRLRRLFQQLSDHLDLESITYSHWSRTGSDTSSYDMALQEHRDAVIAALESLAEPLLDVKGPFQRLEIHRATDLSLQALRSAQREDDADPWVRLNSKSLSFLKLLDTVRASLARGIGSDLHVERLAPSADGFQILFKSGWLAGTSLLEGSRSPSLGSQYGWKMVWPIVCDDQALWNSLAGLVDLRQHRAGGIALTLEVCQRADHTEEEGLRVHTSRKHFFAPLSEVGPLLGAHRLDLAMLSKAASRAETHPGELTALEFRIKDLTMLFDLVPSEVRGHRELSITCNANLERVARVYAETGLYWVEEEALASALATVEDRESAPVRAHKESAESVASAASDTVSPPIANTEGDVVETNIHVTHLVKTGSSEIVIDLRARLFPGGQKFHTLIDKFLSLIKEPSDPSSIGAVDSATPDGEGGAPLRLPEGPGNPGEQARNRNSLRGTNCMWDVGILTIVPDEMRAVKDGLGRRPGFQERRGQLHNRFFYEGTIPAAVGQDHKVVALRALEQGNRSIMAAYQALTQEYRPALVVLLGIGGAIHKDIAICDVAIAEAIYYYERRAVASEGPRRRILSYGMPAWLRVWINRLYDSHGDVPRFEAEPGSPNAHFRMLLGPIGAGEAVIKHREASERQWLETVNDKTLALETEAAGVAQQFSEDELSNTYRAKGYLIIRGISDHADTAKDDRWRYLASANAFRALEQILITIPRPMGS
ncbi:MAG TPA: hypothetical protein VHW09_17560 [Bryobacteraceae bacterium]|nr:hypothetical protein [Bryobacteraceae bacterium]